MLLLLRCYFITILSFSVVGSGHSNITPNNPRLHSDALLVKVKNGFIRGNTYKTVDQNKTYYAFRGIPYAEPPIGNLRFRAPVPVKFSKTLYFTNKEPPECVQNIVSVTGSEDCLYINIYTPTLPSLSHATLPVMVWVYGGIFLYGNSSYQKYGPDYFLDQDVVVAMFNYRLGIFGFLSTNDSTAPGNYGLKDQLLALQWVKENIAQFSGDPRQVTIFGESAGGTSVSYLLQSERARGLFHRAIMDSGSSLCPWSLSRYARQAAFNVGYLLGLNTTNSESLVEDLRGVPYAKLQIVSIEAQELTEFLPKNGLVYAPVSEPPSEEAVFTGKSYELLKRGFYIKVPTIIGYNSQESAIVNAGGLIGRGILLFYYINIADLPPLDMNINSTVNSFLVGEKIEQFYWGDSSMVLGPEIDALQYGSDQFFNVPIHKSIDLMSRHSKVYYFIFSYIGLLGGDQNAEGYGVEHTQELNYLFRSSNNFTRHDLLVRSRMVKLWTNFIKYGNPTPQKDHLLEDVIWPPAGVKKNGNLMFLDIGHNLRVGENPEEKAMKFWDHLYRTYGHPPFDTY